MEYFGPLSIKLGGPQGLMGGPQGLGGGYHEDAQHHVIVVDEEDQLLLAGGELGRHAQDKVLHLHLGGGKWGVGGPPQKWGGSLST